MKAIPVGRNEAGLLYFVVDGPSTGAVMQKNKKVVNVDFLSYITTKPVERITDTSFHRFLWDGVDSPDNKWKNIIQYQVQPIPEHMLVSVESLSSFPKPTAQRKASMNEKDDRATEFKSLLASGNHEKALSRALRRGARRAATGGIRGFVRGARFNPNAEDADGDGFVQEGTQFARRVSSTVTPKRRRPKRVNRASQRENIFDVDGLRARREYLPTPSQRRWVQRSKDHYRKIYADQNKKVFDAFSNGREIKTYADMQRALRVAFPRFATGTTTFDYMRGSDPDKELEPAHFEHGMAMMLAVLGNPLLAEVDFQVAEDRVWGDGGNADGSTRNMGRHRIQKTANGWVLSAGRDKRMKLGLMYKDEISYDEVRNLQLFGNFQLEIHKMFFTMLEDVEPPLVPGDTGGVPNPNYDDEAEALWDEARRMAARHITLHEMGHAAHLVMAEHDSMLAAGLDFTDDLTLNAVQKRIRDAADDMGAEEALAAFRESALRKMSSDFWLTSATIMNMAQAAQAGDRNAQRQLDQILSMPIPSADGMRTLTVGQELADLLNAAGRQLVPNPTGSRWKPGDPITFGAVFAVFNDLQAQDGNGTVRPIFANKDMPYTNYSPWNGRTIARREEMNDPQGQRTGIKLAVPQLHIIAEHGLPRTPMTPAVSAEEMRPVIEAIARMNLLAQSGNPPRAMLQKVEVGNSQMLLTDLLSGQVDPDVARGEIVTDVFKAIAETLSEVDPDLRSVPASQSAIARNILEALFAGGKMFDDLTPKEKALVREIARQTAGGQWYSYMTHLSEDQPSRYFGFKDMELMAELVTANFLGNELKLTGDDGVQRSLNPEESAALRKLLGWLYPNADFMIG
jgi:hypothetical protein